MIVSYRNKGTEDIVNGLNTKAARKLLVRELHDAAQDLLTMLDTVKSLNELKSPGLSLEKLEDDRKGQWAFRITRRYRICFYWDGQDAHDVEIVDYH